MFLRIFKTILFPFINYSQRNIIFYMIFFFKENGAYSLKIFKNLLSRARVYICVYIRCFRKCEHNFGDILVYWVYSQSYAYIFGNTLYMSVLNAAEYYFYTSHFWWRSKAQFLFILSAQFREPCRLCHSSVIVSCEKDEDDRRDDFVT